MTWSRAQIPKGKIPDPSKDTQREFTSKLASNSKLKKGKIVKHSVTGLSTLTTMAVLRCLLFHCAYKYLPVDLTSA